MNSFDDDLRAALRPLAGDSREVWRQLAPQLPAEPYRPVRRWPVPAAAAAGVLIGLAVAWMSGLGSGAVEPGVQTVRTDPVPDGPPDGPPDAPPPDAPPPEAPPLGRVRMLVGDVIAESAEAGRRGLEAGSVFAGGASIETAAAAFVELELRDGSVMRISERTRLTIVSPAELSLDRGRAWWAAPEPLARRVVHSQGVLEGEEGFTLDLWAEGERFRATTIDGTAMLISMDRTRRRLPPMTTCAIESGILRDRERIYWTFSVMEWQLGLLCGMRDPYAVRKITAPLVEMLTMPDAAEMAEEALRRASACAENVLVEFLAEMDAEEQRVPRRRAARVLADTATWRSRGALFELLGDLDPQVRVFSFRALARVLGKPRRSEEFWSMGSPGARLREAQDWEDETR